MVLVCTADESPLADLRRCGEAVGDAGFGDPDAAQCDAWRCHSVRSKRDLSREREPRARLPPGAAHRQEHRRPARQRQRRRRRSSDRTRSRWSDGQMLINFTRGGGPTCTLRQTPPTAAVRIPSMITDHIVVVGTKLIDAGDVYSQPVAFTSRHAASVRASRPHCMLDNQNYGYRIMARRDDDGPCRTATSASSRAAGSVAISFCSPSLVGLARVCAVVSRRP